MVNNPQHFIALGFGLHNDSQGGNVENIVEFFFLRTHFLINTVVVFQATIDFRMDVVL